MLKGDLASTPIETVLTDLANEAATGCLHVVDDDGEEALVYVKSGLVYAVSVPGQRPQLGSRLISSNALVPENLAEALEAQRTELQGWRLGELLVHLGFVEQDVVEAFVQEQVRDGFTDLMAWNSGRWRFRKGEKTREDVAPPTPLFTLLDEVHARQATWDAIVASVHGPNAVPMLAARGGEAEISLDSETWSLLCKIDGERSITELARECGFTLFEAGAVVRSLVEAGLVDIEEELAPDDDQSDQPLSVVIDTVETDDEVDSWAGAEGLPRTAALAAAFALGGPTSTRAPVTQTIDSDDAERLPDADADSDVHAGPDAVYAGSDAVYAGSDAVYAGSDGASDAEADSEAGSDADAGSAAEAPVVALMEAPALVRVAEAFSRGFAPSNDPSSFVDPFHVPDEIRLRPTPKGSAAPTAPTEDDLRRDRIRQAAAAELAAAHAEAEAMRKGQAGNGHIAQVVNLEARREAAKAEAVRREAQEAERLAAEEAQRLEAERLEAERLEAERLAAEEAARLEAERLAAEEAARAEAERLEAERLAAEEAARAEAERLEAERLAAEEAQRLEAERLAAEEAARAEAERLEAERLAAEEAARAEAERLEAERLAAEEAARVEAERLEVERLAAEEAARAEAERLEAERLEAERLEAERLAAEEAARVEAERLAAEEAARLEAERLEAERLEAERLEVERLAAEEAARVEAERLAAEEAARLEAERLEAERLEVERLAAEEAARVEAERLAAEEAARAEAERLAAEEAARAEAERLEAERLEAERVAAEEEAWFEKEAARAEMQRLAAEQERLAAEDAVRAEAERAAAQEAERAAARAEAERLEAERLALHDAADPSHVASVAAMLSEFSRTGATTLQAEPEPGAPEDDFDDEGLPQPFVQRDLTDTASLLRELSSLGFEDEPSGPSGMRPGPSASRPIPVTPAKKKKGLFGR